MNDDLISRKALKEQFIEGAYTAKGIREIIDDAPTITPGGRYNGKRALSLLSEIEKIARDTFNDPETLDINLYRAQALARIFQLFEYNNEEAADNDSQNTV